MCFFGPKVGDANPSFSHLHDALYGRDSMSRGGREGYQAKEKQRWKDDRVKGAANHQRKKDEKSTKEQEKRTAKEKDKDMKQALNGHSASKQRDALLEQIYKRTKGDQQQYMDSGVPLLDHPLDLKSNASSIQARVGHLTKVVTAMIKLETGKDKAKYKSPSSMPVNDSVTGRVLPKLGQQTAMRERHE